MAKSRPFQWRMPTCDGKAWCTRTLVSSEKISLGVLALTAPTLRQSRFYMPCETVALDAHAITVAGMQHFSLDAGPPHVMFLRNSLGVCPAILRKARVKELLKA